MALICEGFNAETANNSSSKNYCDKLEPQDMDGPRDENSTPSPPSSSCKSKYMHQKLKILTSTVFQAILVLESF